MYDRRYVNRTLKIIKPRIGAACTECSRNVSVASGNSAAMKSRVVGADGLCYDYRRKDKV